MPFVAKRQGRGRGQSTTWLTTPARVPGLYQPPEEPPPDELPPEKPDEELEDEELEDDELEEWVFRGRLRVSLWW